MDLGKSIHGIELGMQAITHVAETDQQARDQVEYARWQNRAGRALGRLAVSNGRVDVTPYEGEPDDGQFLDRLYFSWVYPSFSHQPAHLVSSP